MPRPTRFNPFSLRTLTLSLIAAGSNLSGMSGLAVIRSVVPQNTLSGNSRYGVEIVDNAHHNYLFNSAIGISSDRLNVFGNGTGGVYTGGNNRNTYAGIFTPPNSTTTGKASNISGNVGFGVTVAETGSYTTVQSNCIGYNVLDIQDPAFRNTLVRH